MEAGIAVVNGENEIGIITENADRKGNVGVMFVGYRYSVRVPESELTEVGITIDM